MFETRADVMAMFEQFRSVDKADLGTSQALENHALLVMNALDEAITNMDDPEFLVDMLLTTGKSHQRFENFSMQIFWVFVLLLSSYYYYHTLSALEVLHIMHFYDLGPIYLLTYLLDFILAASWT